MACWLKQYQAIKDSSSNKQELSTPSLLPLHALTIKRIKAQHSFREAGAQRQESALQPPPLKADLFTPFLTTVLLTANVYQCQIRRD